MRCCNIIMKNQILVYIFFGLYSFVRWNIIVTTERVSGREKKKKQMDAQRIYCQFMKTK